jgi:hypothetical protein
MRQRLPSPLRPFDITPPQLIEAAKRIFVSLLRVNTVILGRENELGNEN